MPTSHRHFLQSSITHFRASSPVRTVICHYQPPPRALQLSTSSYIFSYSPTFWFHDTSMGHAHLVCIHILFFLPRERFGSHNFPSPSDGSLLQFLSSLFLTMALSAKETLMYFGYTYAPNLTHQGASVITEKSSATLHTMVEERHQFQQQLVHLQHQNPSKRHKTIHLVQKLKCANSPKEACTVRRMHRLTQPSTHTVRKMHDCLRENPHFS
jgi:hypothetical protein